MAQEVPNGTQNELLQAAEQSGNFWLSCFFLRNLPDGVNSQHISSWVLGTFQKQCIRVAYADESASDKARSGSYLIELSSPTARSIFSRQGRGEQFFFSIQVHCEEVRSEQFAKKMFSDDTGFTNQLPQEESSVARRCLMLWQVSQCSFPVSRNSVMQLFQGCLGEAVKQMKTMSHSPRHSEDKYMIEFASEESVGRVLKAFNAKSSLLAIPVKLQAVKKRAETFARKCLLEADRLPTDNLGAPKQKEGWDEKQQSNKKLNRNSPSTPSPQSGKGVTMPSELDSPLPPPLFPDPIQPPRNHLSEPSFDFQALLPYDGQHPKEDSPGQLGLPLMLSSLLPPGTGPSGMGREPHSHFTLPWSEQALGTTPEDPACLLPLMLDSVSGGDNSVPPWGGFPNENGLETMWNENFRRPNDSEVISDLEQKLYATERENAALIEQAIKTESEVQKLRNELVRQSRMTAALSNELREKDAVLAQLKKPQG